MLLVYMGSTIGNLFPLKHHATSILELAHNDLCGPIRYTILGGVRYFMLIIDDFSRKVGFTCVQPNLKHSLGFKNGSL